jgi:DNA-directed RNA polymerase subunit RPC12/RpoP
MYAVVGCSDCEALWIIKGRPDTTRCPRCGTRHRAETRKRFVETDDEDHAREVRSSMLASRRGDGDAFAALDSFEELGERVGDGVVDDEEFLEAVGVDPDEAAAAGERAGSGSGNGGERRSRRAVVLAAIREQDAPGEDEVVAYAAEHGVPGEYVRRALKKLRRAGEVTHSGGGYRLL